MGTNILCLNVLIKQQNFCSVSLTLCHTFTSINVTTSSSSSFRVGMMTQSLGWKFSSTVFSFLLFYDNFQQVNNYLPICYYFMFLIMFLNFNSVMKKIILPNWNWNYSKFILELHFNLKSVTDSGEMEIILFFLVCNFIERRCSCE